MNISTSVGLKQYQLPELLSAKKLVRVTVAPLLKNENLPKEWYPIIEDEVQRLDREIEALNESLYGNGKTLSVYA